MKKIIYLIATVAFSTFSTQVNAQNTSKTFVIDAGHGGYDSGSKNGDVIENEYSLELAKKIQELAKKKNINVVLTRNENEFLDIQSRVKKSNDLKPDLVISLHLNSSINKDLKGSEVYIAKENNDANSTKIGTDLAELVSINSIENRGLKKGNFKILRDSKVPTFLIELGFISNQNDFETLNSTQHKNQLAEKIVTYLENYQSI
jgi:N-acetylmuramoyl-L-alanine amidase